MKEREAHDARNREGAWRVKEMLSAMRQDLAQAVSAADRCDFQSVLLNYANADEKFFAAERLWKESELSPYNPVVEEILGLAGVSEYDVAPRQVDKARADIIETIGRRCKCERRVNP